MSSYYLPADVSRYVDEKGGRDWLVGLVRSERDGQPTHDEAVEAACPREFCVKCGVRLHHPGDLTCFHCGVRQP